jgi:hypothetical protein
MSSCALCWDKQPAADLVHGTAWRITGNMCAECIKYVGVDDWRPTEVSLASATYNYTNAADWDWNYNYNYSIDPWDGPKYAVTGAISQGARVPMCYHHMTPLQFQGLDNTYTVHLSGSSHLKHTPDVKELPTVGVYLDTGWLSGRLACNSDVPLDLTQPLSLYIGWPDFGALDLELLAEAIDWLIPHLYSNKSTIEIACVGGHGRTGTFLAAVMIHEGWAVKDAIEYIRGGYCNKAIETVDQEDMLAQYYNLINGVTAHEDSNKQVH